jgi:hypothetical protein
MLWHTSFFFFPVRFHPIVSETYTRYAVLIWCPLLPLDSPSTDVFGSIFPSRGFGLTQPLVLVCLLAGRLCFLRLSARQLGPRRHFDKMNERSATMSQRNPWPWMTGSCFLE